jgi:hypothetical protein
MSDSAAVASTGGAGEAQVSSPTSAGSDAGSQALQAAVNVSEQGSKVTGLPPGPPMEQKFKVTVDGREIELPLKEILGGYQKTSAANKRFMEAAQKEKALEAQMAKLKNSPIETLLEQGLTFEQLEPHIEKLLLGRIEEQKLTPEQKKLRELEQKLAEKERAEQEEAERRTKQEQEAQVEQHYNDYQSQLIDAMESGALPKTPYAARKVADIMYSALEAGHDIDMADAIEIFNEDHQTSMRDYVKALDVNHVRELLGEEFIKKLRAEDVAKIQNPTSRRTADKPNKTSAKSDRVSATDFFAELDKKHGKYHAK